ncbi:MAG: glycerate kinase, partial [Candidatus Cloacimonas sp. 4484_143]
MNAGTLLETALKNYSIENNYILVAIGKAAWQMAKAAHEMLGNRIIDGIVITKYEHSKGKIGNLEILEAGHPIVDENSLIATQKAIEKVRNLNENIHVLFLISGGGSAL